METSSPFVTPRKQSMGTRSSLGGAMRYYELAPLRKGRPSVSFQLDESNDDIERAESRRSMALRKSISNLPPAVSSPLEDSGMVLSEDDIKTHLQICAKLDSENKINIKNAWALKIIDVLKQMVTKNSPDILKVAGNSLEIAGKVYGLRVDDLHAEGLKLAGSLARNFSKRTDEADEENIESNTSLEGNQESQQKKKKQKKRRPFFSDAKKHTVNSDPKSWQRPLPKLESAAFSVKTDTGVSVVANLFTNKVKVDAAGYKFMFLSKEKAWQWETGKDLSVNEATDKKFLVKIKPISNLMLCAPIGDFQVDEWNLDEEKKELASQRLDDVVYDDDGIPIPELDGSIYDVFQDRDNDDVHDDDPLEEELAVPHIRQEIEQIVDFRPTEQSLARSTERSEYSYNTLIDTCAGKIDQIWAGPSHWKLKFIRRSRPVYTGQDRLKDQDKDRKRGARKKPEAKRIDISQLKPPIDFSLYEKKPPKKKSHMDDSKITLPLFESSLAQSLENIEGLMMVPSMKPTKKCADLEYARDEFKYDNPNDSRYIPQDEGNEGADLADNHFDNGENDNIDGIFDSQENATAAPWTGANLIDAPQMVPQTDINYAKRAKKMDMKQLKHAIWHILTQTSESATPPKVVPTTFSHVYKKLPKLLNEKMTQDLSCPLAFVALLHLCNEQYLTLHQEDFSDFKIFGSSALSMSDTSN